MTLKGFKDMLSDEGWEWEEKVECGINGLEVSKDLASFHIPYSVIEVLTYEHALKRLGVYV